MVDFFCWLFFLAIIAGLLCLFFWAFLRQEEINEEKRETQARYDNIYQEVLKHSQGLPFANGVGVHMYYCNDKFIFEKDSERYTLYLNNVKSIDLGYLNKQTSNALTGAAAGKIITGGTAGAVIGGLASMSDPSFVITYIDKDNKKKTLYFTTPTGSAYKACDKIRKHFYENHASKTITTDVEL